MRISNQKNYIKFVVCLTLLTIAFNSGKIYSQTKEDTDTTRHFKMGNMPHEQSNKTDSLTPRKSADVEIEITEEGDTITRFIYQAFDFGEIYTSKSAINAESIRMAKERTTKNVESAFIDSKGNEKITVKSLDFSKDVGQIPFQEGVTPSGGKTITIPILTAAISSSVPQAALSYNSQMGNSMAGFGWSIAGLSAISVTNKTIYYDGIAAPIDLSNPENCVFSLDGTRLVANNNSSVPTYHYETAQGYVLVKKIMSGSNIAYFEALFPNGSKATFGYTDNTSMRLSYPLTSIVDLKGYRVDFEYLSSGNMYFVSKIKYGSKSPTSHPAEIRFHYTSRTDYTTAYISNIGISQNRLLTKITSSDNGQVLRTYTLTHTLTNGVNRLAQLDCSSGTSSLNPLVFSYEMYPDYVGDGYLNENSFGFIGQYFNSSNNLYYIRGKMQKNNFADGMLTYPNFSTYGVLETHRKWVPFHWVVSYKLGSTYSPSQTLLIVPKLDFYKDPIPITAEEGFQLLNTADVNGDGVDEIVKVNFNGTSGTKTTLKITVYTLTSDTGYSIRTFNVQVEGTVSSNRYLNPISRSYYFGDFKGDGKVQLLTISHSKTFDNKDRTSYFGLIDLNAGTLLSETTLFSHAPNEGAYVHTLDINGDGKTELCHASTSGYNVYALTGNTFAYQYRSTTVPRNAFSKKVQFGDLNADGKLDILVPPTYSYQNSEYVNIPIWAPENCPICGGAEPITSTYSNECRHCNNNLKLYYEQQPYYAQCRECQNPLQPCGSDPYLPYSTNTPNSPAMEQGICCQIHGSSAFVEINFGYVDNGNAWTCYINTGKGFKSTVQNIVNVESNDKITVIDVNRDGLSDLVQVRNSQAKLYLNSNGVIASTTTINPVPVSGKSDLLPANIVNYYNSSFLVCIKDAQVYTYTFSKDASKANLLTTMTDSYGMLHQNYYTNMSDGGNYIPTTTYRSYPFASSVFPLNLLGSASVSLPNYGANVSNLYYTYYGAVIHQQGLGFCGFEKIKTKDFLQNIETVETKDPEMFGVTTRVDSPYKTATYSYSQDNFANKKNNPRMTYSYETDKLTNVSVWSNYEYDAYNNPTKVTTNYGSSALQTVTTQTYDNLVSSARYLIGQPLIKTIKHTRGGSSWMDKEVIAYNTTTRLPTSKITYTGTSGTNKTGETHWTYDTATGNVTSEKSAPYNVTDFLGTTYTYDPSGRYIVTAKNALNQTTTYSDFDKFGNAKTVTDHKDRPTTRTFDAWGQQTSAKTPDGVTETVTPAWGGQGLYTVTKTVTGQPATVVHYDAAGREIRKGNQRFNGQWQYVDNAYDNKGRLQKVSLPFKGSSPTHWNTYTYDTYNRPTQLSEASGKTTTWSYSGLSVTETKNGIATTKTTDASGALVSVSDPGGTITYALRADGQPSSITAPGNVVTSFGYDAFGRQTSITDPSAGTQTFSESFTAAGVRTQTVKDANGKTVTTVSDKYGRVTSVTRPEFNTTYTYNVDGLLTGETSTNGTSAVFTYDGYDRPATARENAPDGKWLKKTFNYGSGTISSIQYESQNGNIGTENFVYTNGHNTEIKLNNTTSIWKLTEENALGQPTKATTGTMARTYGYTAFGMPTGRSAGNIQSFTYNFDVQKGNLLSRKDNKQGKTETFGYDNLNRLSSIGSQQIGYAQNGNITQMPGVGTLAYGNTDKPYQVTMLTPAGTAVPVREQSVTYTSFQRPNTLTENGITASFAYNAGGDRVKMHVEQGATALLTRYYIGKQYELDAQTNTERLYLGGDAYSAPAVYVKEAGNWKIYYICRDYLGSITHIANSDGSLKQELSYDAWGKLRNPATQVNYAVGSEPALFLGRGYTGHEHLPWFGLINMNARLYDPLLGRFLSPDPYVQNPFMTQNYNRYTYAINNPLVYIDQDGELANWIIGAIIGVFFYAKAAHDNTPKENQGNPLKWNWLPWNWGKPDEVVLHFGSNTDGSGMHGGISMGKAGQPQFMLGYSSNQGSGMGYHHNGNSNMYHPQYDYNKPEKAAISSIQQAIKDYHNIQKMNVEIRNIQNLIKGHNFEINFHSTVTFSNKNSFNTLVVDNLTQEPLAYENLFYSVGIKDTEYAISTPSYPSISIGFDEKNFIIDTYVNLGTTGKYGITTKVDRNIVYTIAIAIALKKYKTVPTHRKIPKTIGFKY